MQRRFLHPSANFIEVQLAWMTVVFIISAIIGKGYGCKVSHKQIDFDAEIELKTSRADSDLLSFVKQHSAFQ